VFRGRECARGYFNSDCTNCDAFYTSFKHEGSTKLRSRFHSAIKSFIVRPSCKFSVWYQSEPNGNLETIDIQAAANAETVVSFKSDSKLFDIILFCIVFL